MFAQSLLVMMKSRLMRLKWMACLLSVLKTAIGAGGGRASWQVCEAGSCARDVKQDEMDVWPSRFSSCWVMSRL